MSSLDQPDWNLLPANPEAFFSLPGEYDLRDLKRSYNALIRKFKPEKYPAEFQKIRAAFEMLNDALRYDEPPRPIDNMNLLTDWDNPGETLPPLEPEESDKPEIVTSSEPAGSRQSRMPSPEFPYPRTLKERLTTEPPEKLYHELDAKPDKSPYEFYIMALLSDLVEDVGRTFPNWLLEGLKEYPSDPVLFELLREYLALDEIPENLAGLLEAISRVVRSDRFYYLTERGWDKLLKNASFMLFRETLSECEANLLDYCIEHKLVFYLHILRPAIMKADIAWIDEAFSQIGLPAQMPYWIEEELDFLEYLVDYRQNRRRFLFGGHLRSVIDHAIIEYFWKGELEGTKRFLELQMELVATQEEILSEFTSVTEELGVVHIIWNHISEEILMGLDEDLASEDPELFKQKTQELACRLVEEGITPENERADIIFKIVLSNVLLLNVFIILYSMTFWGEKLWLDILQLAILVLLDPFAVYFGYRLWEQTTFNYSRFWWRLEIMRFYQTARYPLLDVAQELKHLNGKEIGKTKLLGLDKIAAITRIDLGLWFYTTAQRLLTACQ